MNAYIIAGYRTAVGKAPRGIFRFTRPDDLAAEVIRHLVKAVPTLDPETIDDVIAGCATPEAEMGLNMGRMISLMGLDTVKVHHCRWSREHEPDAIRRLDSNPEC